MKKNEFNILKIYMKLYTFAGIILGLMELISYKSLGEAPGADLYISRFDIMMLLVLQTVSLAMVYPIFLISKDWRLKSGKLPNYRFELNFKRIHFVTFVIIVAELIFSLKTGNAILGRKVSSGFSFLFNLIKISAWMPIYYVCARETKKPLYWINVILYVVYQLMCGWSFQILQVIIFEAYLYVKYKKNGKFIKTVIRFSGIMTIVAFIAGSYLYSYAFSLKNSIRYGLELGSIPPLSFMEGAQQLLSRFTNFPITVVAAQNHAKIAALYSLQGKPFWELQAILSPLLPRFFMPIKEYRPLGNIVKWALWEDQEIGNGTGYNFFVYWANILECNISCFVIGIVVFLVLTICSIKIIYAFDNGSKDVEVLYFFFLFGLFSETSLATNFGYGYISLIYTIPILFLIGAIKIKRRQQFRKEYIKKIALNAQYL